MQRERQASPLRIVLTMAVAGVAAGGVLAVVYATTEPRIEANHAEALRRAVFEAVPGTVRIEPRVLGDDGKLATPPQGAKKLPEGRVVYAGLGKDGKLVGYGVPAEGPGFQDVIRLLYGFDPARRRIVGMVVLDSRETPGLGDRVGYDPNFLANFKDLAVEPKLVPVKKGKKQRPNEVDCITGATISSKAVVRILNQSLQRWLPVLTGRRTAQGNRTP